MEAVSPTGDDPDLAVEALGATIVEPDGHDGEDAFEVLLDGLGHPLERREPGTTCPTDPLEELAADDVNLAPSQDVHQGLLEKVSAIEAAVCFLKECEALLLQAGQVPWVLEAAPTGSS